MDIKNKYSDKDCIKWKKNKLINPITKRKIQEGKGVYNDFKKNCSHINSKSLDKFSNDKSPENKNKNKNNKYSDKDCIEWKRNKLINPITKRKIQEGKGVYNDFKKNCSHINSKSLEKSSEKSSYKSSYKNKEEEKKESKSKLIKDKFKYRLLEKLKKIREKLKEDEDIYINEDHRKMCIAYKKYNDLKNSLDIKEKNVSFKFSVYMDSIIDKKTLIKYSNKKMGFEEQQLTLTFKYNDYNKKFIDNMNYVINIEYLQEYIKEQSLYMNSLGIRDIYNLELFYNIYIYINKYLSKRIKIKDLFKNIYEDQLDITNEFLLFYYQFYDHFSKSNSYKSMKDFMIFINTNINRFDDDLLESILKSYLNEINVIILNAPKTKNNFYVYYVPSSNEINVKSEKGVYVSDKFIIGNLIINSIELHSNSYIYEIFVKKGVSLLHISPFSTDAVYLNMLFPLNGNFFIDYGLKIKTVYENNSSICPITTNDIIVNNPDFDTYKSSGLVYYGV